MTLKFYTYDNKILYGYPSLNSLWTIEDGGKKTNNGRGKPVVLVIFAKFPLLYFIWGCLVSQTFPYLSFLNVPFSLKLVL